MARIIAILSALVLVCGGVAVTAATPEPSGDGEIGSMVDIGGRSLYLECRGTGSPTVVFEAGYPNRGDVWDQVAIDPASGHSAVLPAIGATTRVCTYDRPGTVLGDLHSRSDPAPQPRTAAAVAADLHALLAAAGETGPFVLAGHSIGGIFVRLYAATYPDEVAGLVLVDASHEDQNRRLQEVMTPQQYAAFMAIQMPPDPNYPERELIDLDASFAQMQAATPLRPIPLIVLTHTRPVGDGIPEGILPPDTPWDAVEQVWQDLQGELAALTPDARHVIAAGSSHYIQLDRPDLVIEAITQVVDAVRDPNTWATPASPAVAPPD